MSKAALAKKLVTILGEAEKVKKSGMNTYAGYQYTTESDLLELLRPLLVREGIFVFSSVEDVTKEGDITTVVTSHTFIDSESGEEHTIRSAGQGADKQDKGIYKAITGATKYMLWKTFLVESNDDPENDNANAGYVKSASKSTTATAAPKKGFSKAFKKTEPANEEPKVAIKAEVKVDGDVAQTPAKEPVKRKSFGQRKFITEKKTDVAETKKEASF